MKRIISAVAVIFLMAATSFSQTTTKKTDNEIWLDNYEALIKSMNAADSETVPADSIESWRMERAYIRKEYKDIYKDFLTDDETKRYFSLCAQYTKCQARFKFNDASVELNEVGGKVKEGAKKVGNKISGWFEGIKK